jgi:hypothetical protein
MGGHARIVWNNGGADRRLGQRPDHPPSAHLRAELGERAAGEGSRCANGSRSIPWEAFTAASFEPVGGKTIIDWLRIGE